MPSSRMTAVDTRSGITAWRGTKRRWHREFPPDADLFVKGERIYAVSKTTTSIYVKEIEPPAIKGN